MSDEHSIAIVSFEGAIKREIKRIRQKLKDAADILPGNEFAITIKASGRIKDGEVEISYKLCTDKYGSNPVNGNSTYAVVEEFLRRNGWQAVNKPLAIAFDKTREDEIPF